MTTPEHILHAKKIAFSNGLQIGIVLGAVAVAIIAYMIML